MPAGVYLPSQNQAEHWRFVLLYDGNGNPIVPNVDGGLPVHVTNGSSGGTSSADQTPFVAGSSQGTPLMAEDPTSGQLLIAQMSPGTRQLLVAASVTSTPVASNTASAAAQSSVGTTSGQILAANAARKRLTIQNTGTTRIKINLGAVAPTQTAYHFCLPACGTADDGSSPTYIDIMWTGALQAISSSAGGTLVVQEET